MLFVLNIQMLYVKSEIKKVNVFRNNNSSNIKHMYDDSHTIREFYDFFFFFCFVKYYSLANLQIALLIMRIFLAVE